MSVNNNKRARHIVVVGRISKLKNTPKVVQIVAGVLKRDGEAKARFYGPASTKEVLDECISIATAHGFQNRIEFRGNVTTTELCLELSQASVLLMASRQENAPLVVAEANACGVAVVAPESFGFPYMIKSGVNGLFLPDGSLKQQAATVLSALDYAWDRSKIAEYALSLIHI